MDVQKQTHCEHREGLSAVQRNYETKPNHRGESSIFQNGDPKTVSATAGLVRYHAIAPSWSALESQKQTH
jgi:hypothetical protein